MYIVVFYVECAMYVYRMLFYVECAMYVYSGVLCRVRYVCI